MRYCYDAHGKGSLVAAKRIMLEWEHEEEESVMKVTRVFCIFDGTKNVNKGGRSLKKLLFCFSRRSTFLIFPQETNHSTVHTNKPAPQYVEDRALLEAVITVAGPGRLGCNEWQFGHRCQLLSSFYLSLADWLIRVCRYWDASSQIWALIDPVSSFIRCTINRGSVALAQPLPPNYSLIQYVGVCDTVRIKHCCNG